MTELNIFKYQEVGKYINKDIIYTIIGHTSELVWYKLKNETFKMSRKLFKQTFSPIGKYTREQLKQRHLESNLRKQKKANRIENGTIEKTSYNKNCEYIAKKGDTEEVFRSQSEAAVHIGYSSANINQAANKGYKCKGWSIERKQL